jgi:hypothetical protein
LYVQKDEKLNHSPCISVDFDIFRMTTIQFVMRHKNQYFSQVFSSLPQDVPRKALSGTKRNTKRWKIKTARKGFRPSAEYESGCSKALRVH